MSVLFVQEVDRVVLLSLLQAETQLLFLFSGKITATPIAVMLFAVGLFSSERYLLWKVKKSEGNFSLPLKLFWQHCNICLL
jgi:hypothetical protein